jgi:hypothetical protein
MTLTKEIPLLPFSIIVFNGWAIRSMTLTIYPPFLIPIDPFYGWTIDTMTFSMKKPEFGTPTNARGTV